MQHSNGSNFNEKYFLQNLISEFESRLIKIKVCVCVVYICICIPYHLNFSFISFHSLYIRANFQNVVRFSPYLSNKICNKISFHIGSTSSFFRNKILYASLKHVLQRNNSKAKYIFLEYKNLCTITSNMCKYQK